MHAQAVMITPSWVCVEGPNGAGKTHLLAGLTRRFTPGQCALVAELTDTTDSVPREVIAALSTGRSFLRTGHPRTETFALLALKVREYERVAALPGPPQLVLEDRGVDTVAFYQAAIVLGVDADDDAVWELAQEIRALAATWRPTPRLVLVVFDDLELCLARYADRTGETLGPTERGLIMRAARLYERQVAADPARYRPVRRGGRDEVSAIDEMEHLIRTAVEVRT
jgi:dTMP kinase